MSLSEIAFEWRARLRARILTALEQRPMTVREIMAETNASRVPVDRALAVLRKEGKVRMSVADRRGRGMPPSVYSLP